MVDDAEFRGKMLGAVEALREQATRDREDAARDLRDLKADVRQDIESLGTALSKTLTDTLGAIRAEESTWRTEHNRNSSLSWEAHTGDGGVHDAIEARRKEDINRLYTLIGAAALILSTVVGVIGVRVWTTGMLVAPSLGGVGAFLIIGSLTHWPKWLFGVALAATR